MIRFQKSVLIIAILVSAMISANTFAQSRWLVKSLYLQAPGMVHSHNYSRGSLDTVYDNKVQIPSYFYNIPNFILKEFSVNGDSISMVYADIYSHPDLHSIQFKLDTINKRLINFSYRFVRDEEYGSTYESGTEYFRFSSMGYKLLDDSHIFVDDTGKIVRENFVTLEDHYKYTEKNGANTSHLYEYWLTSLILDDTASFIFNINLELTKPVNAVSQSNDALSFSISTSLPDHTINFSLPSSSYPETLFIYDILGREAARFEIAAGMTQYSMNSSRFPSGHYFARLGNSTSHFAIE